MKQDLTGQTIGNYRIESLLGSGGMGQVYRSVHLLLNRPAAIKVMHSHLAADQNFQARFVQEAQAAADLDHPNIIQVYEFGEQDNQFFMVMELISDGSLRGLMRSQSGAARQWSLGMGLELVRQAASGLQYAHGRGMVHRDIKPDNLLVKRDASRASGIDGGYTIKITDFGLARLAEGGMHTMSGVTMGTPAYMSPEQFQGSAVDGRSDIYSLGVVLYEVATGYLPFDVRTLSDAVYKHVYSEPPRPLEVNPALSPEVEAIIMRCLAKKPDERYQSAVDLDNAIQSVVADSSVNTQMSITRGTEQRPPETTGRLPPAQPTTFQSPAGGPPAFIPTLMGDVQTPRVQVLEQSGRSVQVVNLTGDGLTLGRLPENDISLDDESVSRFHLRLDWDGSRVRITDLGSSNGTILAGHRIPPHMGQTWNPGDWLRVGSYWLRLDLPTQQPSRDTAFATMQGEASGAVTPPFADPASTSDPGRIQVVLEEGDLTITPGQPAMLRVNLANLGKTVDHLRVTVEGVPESWVHRPLDDIQLNPGAQYPLTMQVSVPRAPDSYAGEYPITVRARSRENPTDSGIASALWRVQPFSDSSLRISPSRAGGRARASYRLALENAGNATERFRLQGEDDEHAMRYRFAQDLVELGPGDKVTIPVAVGVTRRWIGSPQVRSFTVQAAPSSGQPQVVSGQVVHQAMFPPWVIPVAGALLLALGVLAFQLMKPSIVDFDSDSQSVMAGSPLSLSWDVRRARNLELRNLPPAGEGDCVLMGNLADDRSCTLITDQPGNYTIRLIATGWFRSEERTLQIAVDPDPGHPPEVVTFTLQPSEVTAGEPVTITWDVENAERVIITFPNGVEREVPGSGAMEDVPTQTGSYTLRAYNPGGDTDPLLLGIAVAQPTPEPTAPPSPVTTEATTSPGEPSPTPAPTPPALAIEPAMNVTVPEGVCLKLAWNIQHAATTLLDGDPIPASGDRVVCPVTSTPYTWQVTGHDGMNYDQARQVIVEPFLVDENVTIDNFVGAWIATDNETLGITRMIIAKTPQDQLEVTTYMRFLPLDQLVLLGYGIELSQVTVPFDSHKPRVVYEDPHLRMTLGRKNDRLLARVYYFEHEFAKEYELQPQLVVQPVPVTPQVQFIPPDKFWEQPLFNLP